MKVWSQSVLSLSLSLSKTLFRFSSYFTWLLPSTPRRRDCWALRSDRLWSDIFRTWDRTKLFSLRDRSWHSVRRWNSRNKDSHLSVPEQIRGKFQVRNGKKYISHSFDFLEKNRRITETPRQSSELPTKIFVNSEKSNLQRASDQIQFPDSENHPNILLNSLTLQQKLSFQQKFNSLNEKQQQFVFTKLLTSPPAIQASFAEEI